MSRFIPLADIPRSARARERAARAIYSTRAEALAAARYEIVAAPGCHSRPYFDPPRIGWVCSRAAAEAIVGTPTHMLDGTSHHRRAVRAHEVAS